MKNDYDKTEYFTDSEFGQIIKVILLVAMILFMLFVLYAITRAALFS